MIECDNRLIFKRLDWSGSALGLFLGLLALVPFQQNPFHSIFQCHLHHHSLFQYHLHHHSIVQYHLHHNSPFQYHYHHHLSYACQGHPDDHPAPLLHLGLFVCFNIFNIIQYSRIYFIYFNIFPACLWKVNKERFHLLAVLIINITDTAINT